ncbi:hypothetical protein GRS48_03485 [Halorubrum sp. JWXQ-INN 858]|uniref:hypothetical protein n=1 Tax=Halorubrum sp. JWXQ-INN 858 TaxID=2690782 RepID=UPI001356CFE8|nr:hypothetical protein [Halorubrum sp. JWXQ-INN 858]MWV63888.1 hypothetical protein [Halorubrum sp. JWXQ-INN 858]
MEQHGDDDVMYVCSEDGLALTGREIRERAQRNEGVAPIESAGRVLHAWDVTDDRNDPLYREYVTTAGYLVSDEEVITTSQAFAETYVYPWILEPEAIREAAAEADEETTLGGLRKRHPDEETGFLAENAEAIAEAMGSFQLTLSQHWLGVWENAHPYLVGDDHVYYLPIKGPNAAVDVRDEFIDFVTSYDDVNRRKATVLWEAADPVLRVPIDLYIEGEQVA